MIDGKVKKSRRHSLIGLIGLCHTAAMLFRETEKALFYHRQPILGDPGAVSRVDKMFVEKVFCKIETILQKTFSTNIYRPD